MINTNFFAIKDKDSLPNTILYFMSIDISLGVNDTHLYIIYTFNYSIIYMIIYPNLYLVLINEFKVSIIIYFYYYYKYLVREYKNSKMAFLSST